MTADNLQETLENVRDRCLRGNDIPPVLHALWEQQLADEESLLINAGEATLIDSLEGDFFEGYRPEQIEDASLSTAYEKFFEQVAFFAKEADGALIGFWLRGDRPHDLAAAPIVGLDNEGSFRIYGLAFADYVIGRADADFFIDEEEEVPMLDGLRAWLSDQGLSQTKSQEEIYGECDDFEPSPDDVFNALWDEARG